jgi:hypothetical protein
MVNRAPVLTLWAAVVAEVLGFEHDEALTLGRAVAGLNAYSKGVSLGLFQPTPTEVKEQRRKMRKEEIVTIDLLRSGDLSEKNMPYRRIERSCSRSSYGLTPELEELNMFRISGAQRLNATFKVNYPLNSVA